MGSGRADPILLLVASDVFWDSQLSLAPWRANSSGVVSNEQIVPELGLGSFLALSCASFEIATARTLASSEQKVSKQTRSHLDIVP